MYIYILKDDIRKCFTVKIRVQIILFIKNFLELYIYGKCQLLKISSSFTDVFLLGFQKLTFIRVVSICEFDIFKINHMHCVNILI